MVSCDEHVEGDNPNQKEPVLPVWGLSRYGNKFIFVLKIVFEKSYNICRLDKCSERQRKSYKNCDLYIVTWNVLRLQRAGMLRHNWKNVELLLQKLMR